MLDHPFIVLDPISSCGKSSTREKELQQAFIRSHTATISHKARKAKSRPPGNIRNKFVAIRTPQEDDESSRSPASAQTSSVPRTSRTSKQDKRSNSSDGCVDRQDDSDAHVSPSSVTTISRSDTSSLPLILRDGHGFQMNPFICVRQQDKSSLWKAVQFYQHAVAPSQTAVEHVFNVDTVFAECLLRLLMQDELRACAVATVLGILHSHISPGKQPPHEILYYMHRGLVDHRRRIQSGTVDDFTVGNTVFHAIAAHSMNDAVSFDVHQNSLKPLLERIGGLETCDMSVQSGILQAESALSLCSGSPFLFADFRSAHPGYYSNEISQKTAELPLGFQELAKRGRLGVDVIEVLARAARTSSQTIGRMIKTVEQHHPFEAVPRRYSDFREACPCLARSDDANGRPDLEKLIVLALILYCFHNFSRGLNLTLYYRASRQKLTADVPRRTSYSKEEEDVMRWIWANAIDGWRYTNGTLMPHGLDLLQKLRSTDLCLATQRERQEWSKRFFSDEAFCERSSYYLRPCRSRTPASVGVEQEYFGEEDIFFE